MGGVEDERSDQGRDSLCQFEDRQPDLGESIHDDGKNWRPLVLCGGVMKIVHNEKVCWFQRQILTVGLASVVAVGGYMYRRMDLQVQALDKRNETIAVIVADQTTIHTQMNRIEHDVAEIRAVLIGDLEPKRGTSRRWRESTV